MTKPQSTIDPRTVEGKMEKTSETTWIIQLEEDPVTGDLFMPIPDELMKAQGWDIGDTLTWDIKDTGELSLTKKDEHE